MDENDEVKDSLAAILGIPPPVHLMSLRDYFAGQALAGAFVPDGNTDIHDDIMARRCYELADAMIAERSLPYRKDGRGLC